MDKVRVWIYLEYDMPASEFNVDAYMEGVFKNDSDYTYVSIVLPDGQSFERSRTERSSESIKKTTVDGEIK